MFSVPSVVNIFLILVFFIAPPETLLREKLADLFDAAGPNYPVYFLAIMDQDQRRPEFDPVAATQRAAGTIGNFFMVNLGHR